MTAPRRVVIDPNVLVSAAISRAGATAVIIELLDAGAITAIISPKLLAELAGVLHRDKFRRWITSDEITAYQAELERLAERVDDPAQVPAVSPDPADDYLIALARTARADALVSGDPDLTELALDDLATIAPRDLLDRLAASYDEPSTNPDRP